MAWADLTQTAQNGLNYAATQIKDEAGNLRFATGRAYADFVCESNGQEWEGKRLVAKRLERQAKIEANAALAAQVDALPDPK